MVDLALIKEHLEVVGSDGGHIDDDKVRLTLTQDQAKAQ